MTPGDAFVDPLIKRGEEIERIDYRVRTLAEGLELESIKEYARAKLKHTTQYPLLDTSQEESAQDLADEEARSAREREAAFLAVLRKALAVLEPVALAALQGALSRGLASLPVPAELRGVVTVVETAALDAARVLAGDVTP